MNTINQEQLASCKFVVDRVTLCEPAGQPLYYTDEPLQEHCERVIKSGLVKLSSNAGINVAFPWLAFGVVDESGSQSWTIVRDDEHNFRVELLGEVRWDAAFAEDAARFDLCLEQALSLSEWDAEVERNLTCEVDDVAQASQL